MLGEYFFLISVKRMLAIYPCNFLSASLHKVNLTGLKVCLDPPVHPVSLPCGHIFCYLCAKVHLTILDGILIHYGPQTGTGSRIRHFKAVFPLPPTHPSWISRIR